ncbi:MAG: sigma-70 family RNA polymerase sigma factor [Treponema sp.]|nr:sigma-70 family RNA polymerase sigma factor [Treponema sp.]
MSMSINERNEFVLNNAGLIKKIASNYKYLNSDYEDLIQDATEKFLEIANKYDEKTGCKVSTFIWPYIREYLFEQNSSINSSLRKKASNIEKAKAMLEQENNRPATNKEIANFLGYSAKKMDAYTNQIMQHKNLSLDYSYNDNDDDSFSLLDTSLYAEESDKDLLRKENIKLIQNAWAKLSSEEQEILSYRTGYKTNLEKPLSLRQVAERMNSNRTTIGYKEKTAVIHLKQLLMEEGFCA